MRAAGLLLLLALAGCGAPAASPTLGQQRAAQQQQAMDFAQDQLRSCTDRILQNPDNAAAAALFPLHNSGALTVAQLSNPARPTRAEMNRIIAFGQDFQQCWTSISPTMRAVDPGFASIVETNFRENSLIIADMAQGRLSLGDANRRMQAEDAGIKAQTQAHFQRRLAGFVQEHQAELAMRQAQAAASQAEMAAFGMQLQQMGRDINANAQSSLANSSAYRAPTVQGFAPPPNSIVNCFQAGPVVHCR
ncbi:hypothetical protein [Teichococcus cervicalis]|uniref:Lipoprotein n=2 Tax=Teichococcus cervicalis TaxID=204525 RepID=D5RRS8_9PROT|nr:hypothetical protein [Pseudoroseomonas cervicalis]EFH09994.1 hypothetical protein HMPREF0731_3790 [Pseudoroseomonas cervicalis ATCC 49957]